MDELYNAVQDIADSYYEYGYECYLIDKQDPDIQFYQERYKIVQDVADRISWSTI